MTQLVTGFPAAEQMFAADEASRALGIELVDLGQGRAVLRMTVTERMVNGHGIAHGGYLFLLADSAFACACNSAGPVTVAAAADIAFIAPAHAGDELVAVAEERLSYGRSGIYDVRVSRGDEVVAEFRGRSRVLRPGAATGAHVDGTTGNVIGVEGIGDGASGYVHDPGGYGPSTGGIGDDSATKES